MSENHTSGRRPLAYKNEKFIDSPDARPLRMLSEYLEPLSHFRHEKIRDTIVFFGSARLNETGPMSRYYSEASDLAGMLTKWSDSLHNSSRRFVICTGGGPGIMEAANRGANAVGGKTIGLNIRLPHEQEPNPYITPELSFEFHYFFLRKFWFAYLAKALVVFPGGFGTMDEMFEILTLVQTEKLQKKMVILLYGTEFWNEVVNFPALVKHGVIGADDMKLFQFADDTQTAFRILQDGLTEYYLQPKEHFAEPETEMPAIAKSRT